LCRIGDLALEAGTGLRYRWLRAAPCSLGIALGVAAVVVVLAVPASTQRALLDRLGRDGNLLTVASGNTINNQPVPLPVSAPGMVGRISGVQQVSPVAYLASRIARRTTLVAVQDTNGISVQAADPSLAGTLGLQVVSGRFLDAATARFPAVQVANVRGLLAPTAMPADPGSVSVGRPSDLLVARAEARSSLNALALGLGAVALLIGGVGVASVMIVSVLERRGEIGLRRALGATRATISLLFLAESTLLCVLGAALGAGLGVAVALGYAAIQHIPPMLPAAPILAGLAGSLVVGLAAGVYPAQRAARLAPSAALRGPG
jgi:ABC-type lipoprotein release transport system permease subunit